MKQKEGNRWNWPEAAMALILGKDSIRVQEAYCPLYTDARNNHRKGEQYEY